MRKKWNIRMPWKLLHFSFLSDNPFPEGKRQQILLLTGYPRKDVFSPILG
jgi:hypothetical protein